jgi:uncharacterized linocin/CFP29 family protein
MRNAALLGSAAALLGAGHLNALAMRPYIDPADGSARIVVNRGGDDFGTMNVNAALLQYDEWKDIDRTVIEVATQRLVGIGDLQSRGLTHPLGSIGQTISLWDKSSDMTQADVDMSGVTEGEEDTPAFDTDQVPVPVVHKSFRVNLRRLEASRRFGESIDVMASSIASRLVAERSEQMLFGGSPIQVEGGVIYGYTNHPDRTPVTMDTVWTSATPQEIVQDVQAMLQAARNDRHYGPFCMYIPGGYETRLDDDYLVGDAGEGITVTTKTIRQRILELQGISEIKVADFLTANNVILVQMTRDVVDLAVAQDITTVQWSTNGGMTERFKVMAIWVPRLKSDYDGRSGIVHLAPE